MQPGDFHGAGYAQAMLHRRYAEAAVLAQEGEAWCDGRIGQHEMVASFRVQRELDAKRLEQRLAPGSASEDNGAEATIVDVGEKRKGAILLRQDFHDPLGDD